jgi:hypothetical protein
VIALLFAAVALLDALVFVDLLITKSRDPSRAYFFIPWWGISAFGCAAAAQATLDRNRQKSSTGPEERSIR